MKNERTVLGLVSVAIVFAATCMPMDADAAEVWSGRTKITVLYPTSNSFVFNVQYSNPLSTCDNGRRYEISMTTPNYNVMASSLLAAFMGGKEINFNFNDSGGPRCAIVINRFFVYE